MQEPVATRQVLKALAPMHTHNASAARFNQQSRTESVAQHDCLYDVSQSGAQRLLPHLFVRVLLAQHAAARGDEQRCVVENTDTNQRKHAYNRRRLAQCPR